MSAQDDHHRREAERIRSVYRRRRERGAEARYSLFEPAHLFHSQSLEWAFLRVLRREGYRSLDGLRVLDAGCGGASWLDSLTRYGASPGDLVGVDLRKEALPHGGSRLHLAVAAGSRLPFVSESFDLVCQLTMMSSVLDRTLRHRIAIEMLRVLRPSGLLLWYDFTINPFNPDVRGIGARELRSLFAGSLVRMERLTLAPPLARLVVPRSRALALLLEEAPWLRTHLLATIRRRPRTGV